MKALGCAALMLLATVGSNNPAMAGGFYVGVNGGGGLGPTSQTLTVDPLITALGVSTTGTYEVRGAIVGATLGYNYQTGPWVLGIEGDIDWSNIGGQVTGPVMGIPATFETAAVLAEHVSRPRWLRLWSDFPLPNRRRSVRRHTCDGRNYNTRIRKCARRSQ